MILLMRKSKIDNKLEYFRKLIMDHLDSLESDENAMNKARGYSVGTIREWKGKKYVKNLDGKWRPKYDEHSRGAKLSIAALKKKVTAAKDVSELLDIITANKKRFKDANGKYYPFVYELARYVKEQKESKTAKKPINIKKLQNVVAQQRMTFAEVDSHNLEPIENILQNNKDVKYYFPKSEAEKSSKKNEKILEIDKIKAMYHNEDGTPKEGWLKAPNGKDTNLTEKQWLQVRTPQFKSWFGDWERIAKIEAIEAIVPKEYKTKEISKRDAKTMFQKFNPVNKAFITDFFQPNDARKIPINKGENISNIEKTLSISFPGETVGKLGGFFNANKKGIISNIREIFDKSQYAYSSNYSITGTRHDGTSHKAHPNIKAYHHFVNKVMVDKKTYYVRFTAQELKNNGQLHSAHITEVEIIQKKADIATAHFPDNNRGGTVQSAYDSNLLKFFNSVKGNVSKIVDENGEPRVVYHGTDSEFDTFDKKKLGEQSRGWNTAYFGFYFSSVGGKYGKKSIPAFLNIRKPYQINVKTAADFDYDYKHFDTKNFKKNDGAIISVEELNSGEVANEHYIAFEPNQIKSAINNEGNFDPKNNSINKSQNKEKPMRLLMKKAKTDNKLEYFRKKILDHLTGLEAEEEKETKAMNKAMAKARGYSVGTIREWKGKKYIKAPDGKWKPKYDSHSRGAKMAVAAIKREIAAAKTAEDMLQIVLKHRDRFSDNNGYPLPFVQELSAYVNEQQEQKQPKEKPAKEEKKPKTEKKEKPTETIIDSNTNKQDYNKAVLEAAKWCRKNGVLPNTKNVLNWANENSVKLPIHKLSQQKNPFIRKFIEDMDDEFEKIVEAEQVTQDALTDIAKDAEKKKEEKPTDDGFSKIQQKYQSAKAIEGDEDEIQVGKETITGKWKLVEADTPTASHDENTFTKTEGFPTNEGGTTINDRDYENDGAAQELVLEYGADYDGQALSFDEPVIVSQDGVVISGNNRTMSSKIAAKKGTDKKYIETLKKRAKKFGFTLDQIGEFKNPRVVFETEIDNYSTKKFAKFNKESKKKMNPIEEAVKVSKIMESGTIESMAGKIAEFDTLGELYANRKAANELFNVLQTDGIISGADRPMYITERGITDAGKSFIETVLIGSVINEKNIRALDADGCKNIRQKLVRAIIPLIENKGMKGYSIVNELNDAVRITMEVATNKDKFNSVIEYAQQQNMFEKLDPVAVELAKKLDGTQKEFAEFMQTMNGGLRVAANGEADIFLGEVESKEAILSRILNLKAIKKAVDRVFFLFRKKKDLQSVEDML